MATLNTEKTSDLSEQACIALLAVLELHSKLRAYPEIIIYAQE